MSGSASAYAGKALSIGFGAMTMVGTFMRQLEAENRPRRSF
jgi:hypothetical protein